MADLATVEVDRQDDAVVAVIHGDIDLSNIQVVRGQLDAVLADGHARHVVDLTHTTFIDSVGIHLLFSIADSLRTRRQELRIVIPETSSVARVLRLTDVPSVIPMYSDVASALNAPDEFSF
jgi:anti-anti-sigma factor